MTYKPTDAELDALRQADNGELNFVTLRQFRIIARAALAKWGSPVVAGEPVAWYEYNADLDAWFLAYSHNPKAKTRPLVFGDTTPQPTQAQAGAVPLTDEQIKDLQDDGVFLGTCRQIVRAIEAAHGIKGGQHGAE